MKKKSEPKAKIPRLKLEQRGLLICQLREKLAHAWLHASREFLKNPSPENEKALHNATHELQTYLTDYCWHG